MDAAAPDPTYERLAYEAAQRALDKQERLIDELRSRTGLLLAAASLAASFLGREAFVDDPKDGLAILALAAFLFAVGASVQVLLPKTEKFVFAMVGAGLYEGLYEVKEDLAEVYRQLAYQLDRFWDGNDVDLQKLFRAFRLAAFALSAEIVVLIVMVSDNLFQDMASSTKQTSPPNANSPKPPPPPPPIPGLGRPETSGGVSGHGK